MIIERLEKLKDVLDNIIVDLKHNKTSDIKSILKSISLELEDIVFHWDKKEET